MPFEDLFAFLTRGGPVLWLIGALSVLTLALILWKIWQLFRLGAWSGADTRRAVDAWANGDLSAAERLSTRRSLRARLARSAMSLSANPQIETEHAREELVRQAKRHLTEARAGLRPLELIMTIAPLLGLLGTVLGMIDAFQALQDSGSRADPAALAGGIWEALLTTAAGMAVAIPAGIALSWGESVAERLQLDLEDIATRIFLTAPRT